MGEGSSVSRSVGRSGSGNMPIHQGWGGGGVDFFNNPIVYFVAMYKHLSV